MPPICGITVYPLEIQSAAIRKNELDVKYLLTVHSYDQT